MKRPQPQLHAFAVASPWQKAALLARFNDLCDAIVAARITLKVAIETGRRKAIGALDAIRLTLNGLPLPEGPELRISA
jgi:hypothetical protein